MIGKGYVYKGNRISSSQFLMLIFLRKSPMYGYEVLKAMREEFSGLWEPQTGAVYPALKKLEEHGLLRSEPREGKDYYHITDEARNWLEERLASMSNEVLFMSRYFQVISDAATETRPIGEGTSNRPGLPPHILYLVGEEIEPHDKLKHLRKVREMLANGLADMDKEIERLDSKLKEE
ncbi:MAG: PadR family transcriptional regulator [Methanomassiliicoccales archaeon]|jgi:DNA-binding PadR family transcriptional regulator|nr:PadR family transcriptional regulator [Methanomassiliicoccales archaeon]MDD1756467.1 PadR family transcriptional regulator [Methanomassiliicoccales archaeon]